MTLPDGEDFFWGALIAIIVVGLLAGGTMLFKAAWVDGRADFCLVEQAPQVPIGYRLTAHRAWRPDMIVTVTPTLADAQDAAESAHCPLWKP